MMEETSIEQVLARNGKVLEVPAGHSMSPMLRDRRDTMVISLPHGDPKRGDVILFRNPGGGYVLHRIIKEKDGGFLTRGDNCVKCDGIVPKTEVVGVLEGFFKEEKYYDCSSSLAYKTYVVCNRVLYLPFCAFKGTRSFFSHLKKRLTGSNKK